jgi:hypothetical protein
MKNLSASSAVSRRVPFLCCALALACLGLAGPAGATALPIYKCLDKSAGIVYTDIPCKDGERMSDLRAGNADPAAIARLDREREAWDRSAAQRLAEERRAMVEQRRYYNDAPTYLVQEGSGGGGPYDWPDYAFFGGWGYGGYGSGWGNDWRRHGFDGRDGRDGRKDGRFDRFRRERVVPAHPRVPQAHR